MDGRPRRTRYRYTARDRQHLAEGILDVFGWILLVVALLLAVTHVAALVGFAVLAVERGEPVRLGVPAVSRLVREGCARFLIVVLFPFGLGQPPPVARGPGERGRVPVLLVPGHASNRAALLFLRIFLTRRGWAWVWPVNVRAREGGLAEMAALLGRRVRELQRVTGADQVDLVGHSLGGLVAAWYVAHLDEERRIRRVVTLATPWGGTRMAVFAPGRLATELLYGAPALDGLAPPPVPAVSVWSPDDNVVIPASSAVPEGVESAELEGAAHTEMLFSARAYRAVQAALALEARRAEASAS